MREDPGVFQLHNLQDLFCLKSLLCGSQVVGKCEINQECLVIDRVRAAGGLSGDSGSGGCEMGWVIKAAPLLGNMGYMQKKRANDAP